jgi:arsenate reductase (thioredoxin)
MYKSITDLIEALNTQLIPLERLVLLNPLKSFVQNELAANGHVSLVFICTHNSRRSHLSQVWAQLMANYYRRHGVTSYSAGTEATAVYSQTLETLMGHGCVGSKLSEGNNPIWALRFDEQAPPLICFSKALDHPFNPDRNFGAIMTCDSADEACPFVPGASARFPIRYSDPKASDGTDSMVQTYHERSLEIAREMKYIFE